MPSFRKINYSVRPAKAVERRMMSDSFLRLYPFQRVSDYRYIGFGSIYFTDFQLLHRLLGIDDMISIEKDSYSAACFRLNRPYKAIDLKFGHSNQVLPQLSWEKRSIVWLDYDGQLTADVLSDIDTFCANAVSGSVLVISVNAEPPVEPSASARARWEREAGQSFDLDLYRLKELEKAIGNKIPPNIEGSTLRGDGLARVYQRVIYNQAKSELVRRNAMTEPEDCLSFKQIFNFHYQDGARILTVGGVLVSTQDEETFTRCSFDKLDFTRSDTDPYVINVPCLTPTEVRHLNAQLPCSNISALDAPGVSPDDIAAYAQIYRYFPAFSELLLP